MRYSYTVYDDETGHIYSSSASKYHTKGTAIREARRDIKAFLREGRLAPDIDVAIGIDRGDRQIDKLLGAASEVIALPIKDLRDFADG